MIRMFYPQPNPKLIMNLWMNHCQITATMGTGKDISNKIQPMGIALEFMRPTTATAGIRHKISNKVQQRNSVGYIGNHCRWGHYRDKTIHLPRSCTDAAGDVVTRDHPYSDLSFITILLPIRKWHHPNAATQHLERICRFHTTAPWGSPPRLGGREWRDPPSPRAPSRLSAGVRLVFASDSLLHNKVYSYKITKSRLCHSHTFQFPKILQPIQITDHH